MKLVIKLIKDELKYLESQIESLLNDSDELRMNERVLRNNGVDIETNEDKLYHMREAFHDQIDELENNLNQIKNIK